MYNVNECLNSHIGKTKITTTLKANRSESIMCDIKADKTQERMCKGCSASAFNAPLIIDSGQRGCKCLFEILKVLGFP